MNLKALIVAAVFAVLALASLAMYTRRLEVEASGGERVAVLMVAKPAKKDSTLSEANLSAREIPIAYVDDRVVRASDKAKVIGVRVEKDLEPQQALLWSDVAVSGYEDRHLSQLVQPGSRALTLNIAQNYMSVQLLRPGDYVDIVGVVQEGPRPQSVVLLQKVLVLAVGENTMPYREPGAAVSSRVEQLLTISVTLQESQAVALAAQKGPVIAVLRSPDDQSVSDRLPAISQVGPQQAAAKPVAIAKKDPVPQRVVAPQ